MTRRSLFFVHASLLLILLIGNARVGTTGSNGTAVFTSSSQPTVSLLPTNSSLLKFESLALNLSIFNVTDLYLWVVTIEWNSSLLNLTGYSEGPFLKQGGPTTFIAGKVGPGKVEGLTCSLRGSILGVTGNGTLATFQFVAAAAGWTSINITFSDLLGSNGNSMAHYTINSTVTVFNVPHDVAISEVHLSQTYVAVGEIVSVQVDAADIGDSSESFWVAVYADVNATVVGDEIAVGNQTVDLLSMGSTVLSFSWNTTGEACGNYTISAEAQVVPGETNKVDNMLVDGTVQVVPLVQDIAVTTIRAAGFASIGDSIRVEVDLQNRGTASVEAGSVTLYADMDATVVSDEIVIGVETVAIGRFGSVTVAFYWNSAGVTEGTYTFTAVASPLPRETSLNDNTKTCSRIELIILHTHASNAMWIEKPITALTLDNANVGSRFNITVWLNLTQNIFGYQIALLYNRTQLECTRVGLTSGTTSCYFAGHAAQIGGPVVDTSFLGNGSILIIESCVGCDFVQGPRCSSLIWAEFEVAAVPSVKNLVSGLDISTEYSDNTWVLDADQNKVVFAPADGYYEFVSYPPVHDAEVTDAQPSQEAIYVGDLMLVEVNVQNNGDIPETMNVTLYADRNTTVVGDEIVVGVNTVTVDAFGSMTTVFNWNTINAPAGNYTFTAAASQVPGDVNVMNNNKTGGCAVLFQALLPCPNINVVCPANLTVNPSIFTYDPNLQARLINVGNVSIVSTGFEGGLRVVGSRNGTIRLCVDQPDIDFFNFYLPQQGEVQVPLWLMFQPETHWEEYSGTYTLSLTVCGTHVQHLIIREIDITVCQNGAYIVNSETATFTWNLTGGSLVYLAAETDLPQGWTYSVDPPVGTLFETPQIVTVNITAPPDAEEGEMGRVTLMAYKNSTGTMIWQFIYFASTDNKPPTVERMETPILSPDGYLLFNATVSDHSGIGRVTLCYSIDGGAWQNATMQWAAGDTFNSTQYTRREFFGTTPKTVQYYMSAADWLGNETDTATQTISILNDITVTDFKIDRTTVFEGDTFSISVTVTNQGTLPLSYVNFALYANSGVVATQPIFSLWSGASITLNFSVLLFRGTYAMAALAIPFPEESNVENNVERGTVEIVQRPSGGGGRVPSIQ
jgi:hypothetical protein